MLECFLNVFFKSEECMRGRSGKFLYLRKRVSHQIVTLWQLSCFAWEKKNPKLFQTDLFRVFFFPWDSLEFLAHGTHLQFSTAYRNSWIYCFLCYSTSLDGFFHYFFFCWYSLKIKIYIYLSPAYSTWRNF